MTLSAKLADDTAVFPGQSLKFKSLQCPVRLPGIIPRPGQRAGAGILCPALPENDPRQRGSALNPDELFSCFHVDRTSWPLGGELHLPAPNTLSHLPKRKKTTKQPSPGSPLPSNDEWLAAVTLLCDRELVTRGFGLATLCPTGLE